MLKKIIAAIAGALAAAGLLLAPSASATAKPDDCNRVATADRPLCQSVKRQLAYAYATPGAGLKQIADGRTLVHTITHSGLSKTAMHKALTKQATAYAKYAAVPGTVVVNTATMRQYFGSDAHYEVYRQGRDVAVSIVQP